MQSGPTDTSPRSLSPVETTERSIEDTDEHVITAAPLSSAPQVSSFADSDIVTALRPGSPFKASDTLELRSSPIRSSRLSDSDSKSSDDKTPLFIKLARDGRLHQLRRLDPTSITDEHGANALHWAAFRGHRKVVEWLLGTGKFDVNAQDAKGNTALHLVTGDPRSVDTRCDAPVKDREGVVSLLLAQPGVVLSLNNARYHAVALAALDVGSRIYTLLKAFVHGEGTDVPRPQLDDRRSIKTALRSIASKSRNASQPDKPDDIERWTSLAKAVLSGNSADVQALLNKGYDPRMYDEDGRTALHFAAACGHVEIAKLLLGKEEVGFFGAAVKLLQPTIPADPNQVTVKSETALIWAIVFEQPAMVELLCNLEGIDIDSPKIVGGMTPLMVAGSRGHVGILKMLLKCGAKPVLATEPGETALTLAAVKGHSACVEALLECGRIPWRDLRTGQGALAMICAAREGHEDIVRRLAPLVDLTFRKEGGDTALVWAVGRNHYQITGILIQQLNDDGIDPNAADATKALWLAAALGCTEALKCLAPHVNCNATDKFGETAIFKAVRNKHHAVVDVLLNHEANPNIVEKRGQAPLHLAVLNDDAKATELLKGKAAPDIGYPDLPVPLTLAAQRGAVGCIPVLLGYTGINVNWQDSLGAGGTSGGRTALHLAATFGHAAAVRLLLQATGIDPTRADNGDCTPLHHAARCGHVEALRELLRDERFRVPEVLNKRSIYLSTALIEAAAEGHVDVVRLLLDQPGIEIDAVNTTGWPAIYCAVSAGHQDVVECLLPRVDPHFRDSLKDFAVECGQDEIAKRLESDTSSGSVEQSPKARSASVTDSATSRTDAFRLYRQATSKPEATPLDDTQIDALKDWLGFPAESGGKPFIAAKLRDTASVKGRAPAHYQAKVLAWFITALDGGTHGDIRAEAISLLAEVLQATPEQSRHQVAIALETLLEAWPRLDDDCRTGLLDHCFTFAMLCKLREDDEQALWLHVCDQVFADLPAGDIRDRVVRLLIEVHGHAMQSGHWEHGSAWMPPLSELPRLDNGLEEAEQEQRPDIAPSLRPRLQLARRIGQIQASDLFWRRCLPSGLGELGTLSEVNFSSNLIDTLPEDVGAWQIEGGLDLSRNRLTSLPPEIGRLKGLKRLDLSGNRLRSLPEDTISKLENLEFLDLSDNQLPSLPADIDRWPFKCRINLSGNDELPPEDVEHVTQGGEHGRAMAKLRIDHGTLYEWVREGDPRHIDSELVAAHAFAQCLEGESTVLDLSGLGLTRWPEHLLRDPRLANLTKIDLSGNRIPDPGGYSHLRKLVEVDLRDCPLASPVLLGDLLDVALGGCTLTISAATVSQTGLAHLLTIPRQSGVATVYLHRRHGGVNVLLPHDEALGALEKWSQGKQGKPSAKECIDTALTTRSDSLDLPGKGLTHLPVGLLGLFQALTTLKLPDNELETLEPLDIMPGLRTLDLGNNRLRQIEGLSSLSELQSLALDHLPLQGELDVGALTQLHTLLLRNTSITRLHGLRALEKLTFLDVSRCKWLDLACLAQLQRRDCRIELGDDIGTLTLEEVIERGELFPQLAQEQVERGLSEASDVRLDFEGFGLTRLPARLDELAASRPKEVGIDLRGNEGIAAVDLFGLLSANSFAWVEIESLDLTKIDADLGDDRALECLLANLSQSAIRLTAQQWTTLKAQLPLIDAPSPMPTYIVDGVAQAPDDDEFDAKLGVKGASSAMVKPTPYIDDEHGTPVDEAFERHVLEWIDTTAARGTVDLELREQLRRQLRECTHGEDKRLDLSGLKARTFLPDEILERIAPHVSDLDISGNCFSDVSGLAKLTGLRHLKLCSNRIYGQAHEKPRDAFEQSLKVVEGLTHLTSLWLAENGLRRAPSLDKLTGLRDVRLNGNDLVELPQGAAKLWARACKMNLEPAVPLALLKALQAYETTQRRTGIARAKALEDLQSGSSEPTERGVRSPSQQPRAPVKKDPVTLDLSGKNLQTLPTLSLNLLSHQPGICDLTNNPLTPAAVRDLVPKLPPDLKLKLDPLDLSGLDLSAASTVGGLSDDLRAILDRLTKDCKVIVGADQVQGQALKQYRASHADAPQVEIRGGDVKTPGKKWIGMPQMPKLPKLPSMPWADSMSDAAKAAMKRIEECRKAGGKKLDLAGLNLTDKDFERLEGEFKKIGHVTELVLDRNALTRVPDLSSFTKLQIFQMNNNGAALTDVSGMRAARTLKKVELKNAQLAGEIDLGRLMLKHLDLQGNQITGMKGLEHSASTLKLLDLQGNDKLKALPDGMGELAKRSQTGQEVEVNTPSLLKNEYDDMVAGKTDTDDTRSQPSTTSHFLQDWNDLAQGQQRVNDKLAEFDQEPLVAQYFHLFHMAAYALMHTAVLLQPVGTRAEVQPQLKNIKRTLANAGLEGLGLAASQLGRIEELGHEVKTAATAVNAARSAFQLMLSQYNLAEFNRLNRGLARLVKPHEIDAFCLSLAIAATELMRQHAARLDRAKPVKHFFAFFSGNREDTSKNTAFRDSAFGHAGLILEGLASGDALDKAGASSDTRPKWMVEQGLRYFFLQKKTKYTLDPNHDAGQQIQQVILWDSIDEKVQMMNARLPGIVRTQRQKIKTLEKTNQLLEQRVLRLENTLNQVISLLPHGKGQDLLIPDEKPLDEVETSGLGKMDEFDLGLQDSQTPPKQGKDAISIARAKLDAAFEAQVGLRCLQHAFRNTWRNFVRLNPNGEQLLAPYQDALTMEQGVQGAELSVALAGTPTPDGKNVPMQIVHLYPQQVAALVPVLETALDLAVVYRGRINQAYRPGQTLPTHHYTGLIRVDGLFFELESLGMGDEKASKIHVPDLGKYFAQFAGGVWIAIRGKASHPLTSLLQPLLAEKLTLTGVAEALAHLQQGPQPLPEMLRYMQHEAYRTLHPGTTEGQWSAMDVVQFLAGTQPGTEYEATQWHGHSSSSARRDELIQWLDDALDAQRMPVMLFTGTHPMVMALKRQADGKWLAHYHDTNQQTQVREPLKDGANLSDVLDVQETKEFAAKKNQQEADDLRRMAWIVTRPLNIGAAKT